MTTTTPLQRRNDASYATNAKKHRCDGCAHVEQSQLMWMASRYDRHCNALDVPIKTHGTCNEHEASEDADLPHTEFPTEGAAA